MRNVIYSLSSKGILILITLLSASLRLLWLQTPVVRDEGGLGYIAMVWLHGISPYSEPMAAVNPPVAYLIYMVFSQIFGRTIIPIRIFNNALCLVSIILLYLIAKEWYDGTVGLVTAFFYGIFVNAPIFENHLAIPSSLSLPFAIASIYFCTISRSRQRYPLFISGFLMSISILILQYEVIMTPLPLVILTYGRYKVFKQYFITGKASLRGLLQDISILSVGALLPFFVTVLYFWTCGALRGLIYSTILRFLGSGYFSQPDVYFSLKFLIIVEALPLWLCSLVGFVLCFLRCKNIDFLVIGWAFLSAFIAIPPPHFGRHFLQLIPPLSILSGIGIAPILVSVRDNIRYPKTFLHNKQIAYDIFFIVTLVVSFLPAIYFQQTQYPNTNFSLFGENWYYTFSRNWGEQQELINYIKTNAADQNIIIHGWEAELYWLSGHLAPGIRWASSYRSPMPDITDEEYYKIFDQVKGGDFHLIILMNAFPPDQIMQYVHSRYFFVKSIGMYSIYSKYNAEGEAIEYNFIEDLAKALQKYGVENLIFGDIHDLNETTYEVTAETLTVEGETRYAIKQIPIMPFESRIIDSILLYDNITISPNSKLKFSIAMNEASWTKNTDGVIFKIIVEHNQTARKLFQVRLNPKENIEDRGWKDYTVDLSNYAGEKVKIYFITNPGSNNAYDWSYWGQPLLVATRK